VHDLPDDLSLPAPKPKGSDSKKKKAHSYLSLVGGELKIHKTWSDCEARVKGRSGAKFKKSTSPEDEKRIIAEWKS
jgi:ribonuclease HI